MFVFNPFSLVFSLLSFFPFRQYDSRLFLFSFSPSLSLSLLIPNYTYRTYIHSIQAKAHIFPNSLLRPFK